jgi:uncharacterized protein YggU (UPF0235/DUF167 family)
VYGRVSWDMFRARPWAYPGELDESRVGNYVLLLGHVMRVRPLSKTRTIVVLFSRSRTVSCMVAASPEDGVTKQMVHFAATLRRGTYVDVEGVVCPLGMEADLLGTTQQVEIQVRKLYTMATKKDGSLVDGVNTTEDDSSVDDESATMEDDGMPVDRVTTMEDISLIHGVATTEDGSPVHGVPVHGVATMEDGCPVDSVAMMGDDGASQSSSISTTTRPSGMLPENQVGRNGEIQARRLHTVTKKHIGSNEGRAKSKKKIAQDPYDSVYGRVSWEMFRARPWTYSGTLDESRVGNYVLLLGHVIRVRPLSKTRTIVVLFSRSRTVSCMVAASPEDGVTTRMVHFAATLRRGTYVDVEGVVCPPGMETDLLGTTQQVEIQVRKLYTMATKKDGSLVDGVNTTEDDSPVDDGSATRDDDGMPVDRAAMMEDGSQFHVVTIDRVTTM